MTKYNRIFFNNQPVLSWINNSLTINAGLLGLTGGPGIPATVTTTAAPAMAVYTTPAEVVVAQPLLANQQNNLNK